MTAEGMRKSELFWPRPRVSTASPWLLWDHGSATEKTRGRERKGGRERERERGLRALCQPRDIPVRSGWGQGSRERRPREVSQSCVERLLGGRGAREEQGGQQEAERRRGDTHGQKGHGGCRAMGVIPAPSPTWGGGGATVETIWIWGAMVMERLRDEVGA